MPIENKLTREDIARLLEDPSTATEMDVMQKLTAHYTAEGEKALSPEEAELTNDIFQLVLDTAKVEVRKLLAENLGQSDRLPVDLVRRMARDVHEVACPVLKHSTALSDTDLISFINADTQKLEAIAGRPKVSEALSDALVETRHERVVSTLVGNEGAQISEQTFEKVTERHSDSAIVVDSMLQRRAIPVKIVEKVIGQLSETMQQEMERKYGNLVELKEMRKALDQSLELTSLRMMGFQSSDEELMRLLRHLDGSDKMTPFAAISMGNLQLFEVALSRLLRVPAMNVRTLMQDANGFRAAYGRAGLPEAIFEAVALAVQAIQDLQQESEDGAGNRRALKSVEVMERMDELAADQEIAGMDYLRALMQHCMRMNTHSQKPVKMPKAGGGAFFAE